MTDLIERREVFIPAIAAAAVLLLFIGLRIRKVAKSDRPDRPLAKVAMLIGLAWGAEAIWELTAGGDFQTPVRIALCAVFEVMFLVSTMRAEQHMAAYSWPGRPGQTVWGLATAMGIVATLVASSSAEAILRFLIPLALAKLWWDGVVGGNTKPRGDVSSWRWTPRRLLLAIGALEPGQKDVAKVHREALANRMTSLYFGLGHGPAWLRKRRTKRLARLSLDADLDIIDTVRQRVGQASWFLATAGGQAPPLAAKPSESADGVAESAVPQSPWDRPELFDLPAQPTVAREAASWLASAGGQVAVAKERVASTTGQPAKYDQAEARRFIRGKLDQGVAAGVVDHWTARQFQVSERTARRLRGLVAGEPVSGPPSDLTDGQVYLEKKEN
jgi:hypothetical protein